MPDKFDSEAEALVKRYKKAELVSIIARLKREAMQYTQRNNSKHDALVKAENECEALRDELSKLQLIRGAVQRVLNQNTAINDKQLTLLLRECEPGYSDDYKGIRAHKIANTHGVDDDSKTTLESAAETLMTLLDACSDGKENPLGEGPSYEDLREMLDLALGERTELLAKLGLTDQQWSARGGSCEADFDY